MKCIGGCRPVPREVSTSAEQPVGTNGTLVCSLSREPEVWLRVEAEVLPQPGRWVGVLDTSMCCMCLVLCQAWSVERASLGLFETLKSLQLSFRQKQWRECSQSNNLILWGTWWYKYHSSIRTALEKGEGMYYLKLKLLHICVQHTWAPLCCKLFLLLRLLRLKISVA